MQIDFSGYTIPMGFSNIYLPQLGRLYLLFVTHMNLQFIRIQVMVHYLRLYKHIKSLFN